MAFIEENAWRDRNELLEMYRDAYPRKTMNVSKLNDVCKRKGWKCGHVGRKHKYATGEIIETGGTYNRVRDSNGRRVQAQRYEWEKMYGPIKSGFVLRCRSENTLDASPANWALMSRGAHSSLTQKFARDFYLLPREMQDLAIQSAEVSAKNWSIHKSSDLGSVLRQSYNKKRKLKRMGESSETAHTQPNSA